LAAQGIEAPAYAVVESVCLSVRLSIYPYIGKSFLKGSRIEALSAPYNRGTFLVSLGQIPFLEYRVSPLTSALERDIPLSRGKISTVSHKWRKVRLLTTCISRT